jgi:S1-C subfamily serine protease
LVRCKQHFGSQFTAPEKNANFSGAFGATKQMIRRLCFLVGATFLVSLLVARAEAEYRNWTSSGGKSREAELVELKPGDIVVLRFKDGKVKELKLSQFSTADQEYARDHAKLSEARSAKPLSEKEIKAATAALKAAKDQCKDCRTPEEALVIYDVLLAHENLPSEVRKAAVQEADHWKQMSDEGLVRFGTKWRTQSEVREARIQAYFALNQGLEMLRLGQGNLGLERLLESSRTDPESIQADFIIATVYALFKQQYEKAAHHYKVCLKRDQKNIAVLNNLGLVEIKLNQYGEAIGYWRLAANQRYDQRLAQNMGRLIEQNAKRNITIEKAALNQISRLYSSTVVANRLGGSNTRVGWQYMIIPREAPADDSEPTNSALADEDQSTVNATTSGFAIAHNYVVTTRSVTRNATSFQIADPNVAGKLFPATLVAKSDDVDVALLRCDGLNVPALPLGLKLPVVESEVVVAGMKPTNGITAPALTARSMVIALPRSSKDAMLVYDADAGFGAGGGPVCDQFGSVVAIHNKNLNLLARRSGAGIPVSAAMAVLQNARPPSQPPPLNELSWEEVNAKASKATVIVLAATRCQDVSLTKQVGPDFQEDCTCCRCKGTGHTDCPVKGCAKGWVTGKSTEFVGRNPNTGATVTAEHEVPVKCTKCDKNGYVLCKVCGGSRIDPELRGRPSSKYHIKDIEEELTESEGGSTRPKKSKGK